jgi:hypothetical protein
MNNKPTPSLRHVKNKSLQWWLQYLKIKYNTIKYNKILKYTPLKRTINKVNARLFI